MGGIHGKIVGLDEDKVVVRISNEPLVKIELVRSSISHVVEDEQE
jgi:preprotein translocase subunit YajC